MRLRKLLLVSVICCLSWLCSSVVSSQCWLNISTFTLKYASSHPRGVRFCFLIKANLVKNILTVPVFQKVSSTFCSWQNCSWHAKPKAFEKRHLTSTRVRRIVGKGGTRACWNFMHSWRYTTHCRCRRAALWVTILVSWMVVPFLALDHSELKIQTREQECKNFTTHAGQFPQFMFVTICATVVCLFFPTPLVDLWEPNGKKLQKSSSNTWQTHACLVHACTGLWVRSMMSASDSVVRSQRWSGQGRPPQGPASTNCSCQHVDQMKRKKNCTTHAACKRPGFEVE